MLNKLDSVPFYENIIHVRGTFSYNNKRLKIPKMPEIDGQTTMAKKDKQ